MHALLRTLRPHQWVKNLLVFVPLLTSHRYGDAVAAGHAGIAFIAFCLAASGVYVLNDLVDIEADRSHPTKRLRPIASGEFSTQAAWAVVPVLLGAALALSWLFLSVQFTAVIALYAFGSILYSFRLKQVPLLDAMTLAALYTLRIIAGAAALPVPLSFWLLALSTFLFLSLALMKRYCELRPARDEGLEGKIRGRGYEAGDLEVVAILGAASGYIAALVLALYIQDPKTAELYARPQLIWLACPLLLYWISNAWLVAHRGRMHDDPVVFALKDRASWVVVVLTAVVFAAARLS
jgi:4-hydroxybenzoate polyprenyltransferase